MFLFADDYAQECSFARTVRAYDAEAGVIRYLQVKSAKNSLSSERESEILNVYHDD